MIELFRKTHRSKIVLMVKFPYNLEMINCIKKHPEAKWSQSNRSWYIPFNKDSLIKLSELFSDISVSEFLDELSEKPDKLPDDKIKADDKSAVRIEYSYNQIRVRLRKDKEDIAFLKDFIYSRWDPKDFCWIIPNYEDNLSMLRLHFGKRIVSVTEIPEKSGDSEKVYTVLKIPKEVDAYISKLTQWMEHKRYSRSSIKSYVEAARLFLAYTHPKPVEELENSDMVDFVNNYIIPRKLSHSFQNHVINAVKLLFREVVKSKIDIEQLDRPRREYKLPNVLSKEEVKLLLNSTENLKHKTMLSLIYACGLRRGELLNIMPRDVDSNRNLLIVRRAKGRKDRVVPLSAKIILLLRDYYKEYSPERWLFEGAQKGEQYTASSIQKVLKKALQKAGIRKPATLHWLRHSYATHLLESGTDLRYIQEILGHKSSRTTEIYTHVSTRNLQSIKSPFDDL